MCTKGEWKHTEDGVLLRWGFTMFRLDVRLQVNYGMAHRNRFLTSFLSFEESVVTYG